MSQYQSLLTLRHRTQRLTILASISLLSCNSPKPTTRNMTLWEPADSVRQPPSRLQGAEWCLTYEPDTVSITGTLQRLTFPGRPNYESLAQGDEPETGFYLVLAQPVCTRGESASTDAYPIGAADTVQLLLDSAGYARLRSSLGLQLTVSGTLAARFTGHHHAPLLLDVLTPQ